MNSCFRSSIIKSSINSRFSTIST